MISRLRGVPVGWRILREIREPRGVRPGRLVQDAIDLDVGLNSRGIDIELARSAAVSTTGLSEGRPRRSEQQDENVGEQGYHGSFHLSTIRRTGGGPQT